ncbi:GGDEF domain-containing protein [Candidatus Parcubacteria bacterium]|nr:MAG: GGDEF domain-containing protein [Candidatus Parcubacteria bacterium]
MQELEILLDKLLIFEKMYQAMRIVDPIGKKVLELRENELCEDDSACYEFWKKQQLCDNCVSIRAFNEDDTIFKIVYKGNNVSMVTAVPVTIEGKRLVVELLKDITNSLVLGDEKRSEDVKVFNMIEYMNRVAVRDSLTDLYNRRYINERLPEDLLNASVKNEPLSIIFADLDFFKKVNDTYGHSAGDFVLKDFAKELERHIRKDRDWAARYGGEEFLICLPNTNLETAREVAERIRSSIEKKEFMADGRPIHLTCSFGVHTVCNGSECMTVDGVIELADKQLYKAKSLGGNRVE